MKLQDVFNIQGMWNLKVRAYVQQKGQEQNGPITGRNLNLNFSIKKSKRHNKVRKYKHSPHSNMLINQALGLLNQTNLLKIF